MIIEYDFGKRLKPCSDCDERGHCIMNCSPGVLCGNRLADEAKKCAGSVRNLPDWSKKK
jgi:hypothetical protein